MWNRLHRCSNNSLHNNVAKRVAKQAEDTNMQHLRCQMAYQVRAFRAGTIARLSTDVVWSDESAEQGFHSCVTMMTTGTLGFVTQTSSLHQIDFFTITSNSRLVVSSQQQNVCEGVSNVTCAKKKKLVSTPQHIHVLDGMFAADSFLNGQRFHVVAAKNMQRGSISRHGN